MLRTIPTDHRRHSMPPEVYQGLTFRKLSCIQYQFQNASPWAAVRFMGSLWTFMQKWKLNNDAKARFDF